mmetsp:Transcript_2589/g.7592  ORF Transcript_2589/g.7592 Transcript_2589/m.7592 type:complete len:213 (-) Transcript_2589:110-748(-)
MREATTGLLVAAVRGDGVLAVLLRAARQRRLEAEADAQVPRELLRLRGRHLVVVVEQAPPLGHEREQAPARRVVLRVVDHVLRDVLDARGEERDLHLRRADVALVPRVRLHGLGALGGAQDAPGHRVVVLDLAHVGGVKVEVREDVLVRGVVDVPGLVVHEGLLEGRAQALGVLEHRRPCLGRARHRRAHCSVPGHAGAHRRGQRAGAHDQG